MSYTIIQKPVSDADFTSNIRALRAIIGKQLGLPIEDGTAGEYAKLSPGDQVKLTDEMAAFIVHNPQFFSSAQVQLAKDRVNSPNFRTPLADTSFAAASSEFFSEYASAVSSKFTQILVITIIAGIATKFAVDAISKAVTKK